MPIPWQSDFADATTLAARERKPLFLDFFNPT